MSYWFCSCEDVSWRRLAISSLRLIGGASNRSIAVQQAHKPGPKRARSPPVYEMEQAWLGETLQQKSHILLLCRGSRSAALPRAIAASSRPPQVE